MGQFTEKDLIRVLNKAEINHAIGAIISSVPYELIERTAKEFQKAVNEIVKEDFEARAEEEEDPIWDLFAPWFVDAFDMMTKTLPDPRISVNALVLNQEIELPIQSTLSNYLEDSVDELIESFKQLFINEYEGEEGVTIVFEGETEELVKTLQNLLRELGIDTDSFSDLEYENPDVLIKAVIEDFEYLNDQILQLQDELKVAKTSAAVLNNIIGFRNFEEKAYQKAVRILANEGDPYDVGWYEAHNYVRGAFNRYLGVLSGVDYIPIHYP